MNTEKAHLLFRLLCTGRLAFCAMLAILSVALHAPLAVAAEDDDLQTVWEGEKTHSNATDEDFGGTDLEHSQTVVEVNYEVVNESAVYGNENASITMTLQGTAGGKVEMGENGVVASGEVGIEAELAALIQGGVGNDMLGVDAAAEAKLKAILKAEGQIGAYIDEKGLTIGAEVKAEAMVSAEASLTTTLTGFGVETSVKVTALAQAGASASAKALVTIGNDGKIHFNVGAGATVGIGGGLNLEFSISIDALLQHLGIKSLSELIEWCEQFIQDPAAFIGQLIEDAKEKIPGMLVEKAKEVITETVTSAYQTAQNILTSFTTNPFSSFLPPISGPPGIGSAGGGGPAGGGMGGASAGGGGPLPEYNRDNQLRTWSE